MADDSNIELAPIPLQPHEIQHCQRLFHAEHTFMPDPGYVDNVNAATLRPVALNAIEAFYKCPDFDAYIPYLAMNYVDRLMSRHEIQRVHDDEGKNRELFVICCLTIAWKMRTKSFKLPGFLANLQKDYEATDVMNMELFILSKLEWRMRSITPFSFADYFISILNPTGDQLISTRKLVRQIIVTSQADIRIATFRPSLVAASVVYAVSKKQLPESSSILRAALLTFEQISKQDLSNCKKMLDTLCNVKVESLKRSSAKKETKAEASSSGIGGTSQVAGASSSPVQESVLPVGGAQHGSPAGKETEGGALNSGVKGSGQVAGGSSPSLQNLFDIEDKSDEHSIPEKSEATIPPGGTADDKDAPNQSMEVTKPEETADDKAMDKNTVEEEQQDMAAGEKAEDNRPVEERQQDPTSIAKRQGKRPVGQIQQVPTPAQEVAPTSAGIDDLQLDFELDWSQYDRYLCEMYALSKLTTSTRTSDTITFVPNVPSFSTIDTIPAASTSQTTIPTVSTSQTNAIHSCCCCYL